MEPPPAIWAIHPDGTGLRRLSIRPATDRYDYQTPAVAPDGTRVSYTSIVPASRIHILDLRTGADTILPAPTGITDQGGSAYFSPDGRLVGYLRFYPDNTFQFVVAPVDGSGTGTPVGPRLSQPAGDVNWTWAPDESAVVVDYGADETVHLLPIDGSPGTLLGKGRPLVRRHPAAGALIVTRHVTPVGRLDWGRAGRPLRPRLCERGPDPTVLTRR